MSDTQQKAPYPLRMPDEMRERLKESAHNNRRSLNAEIVSRLASSLGYIDLTKDSDLEPNEPGDDVEQVLRELDEATERFLKLREMERARINSKSSRSKKGLKASGSGLADD